jgi:hypothetical protein
MFVPTRKMMLGLCLAAGLVFAVTPALAVPSGGCVVGATTTCTFNYTGAPEAWVVPAGVSSATFDLFGGQGGNFAAAALLPGGSGGQGGHVHATVALTPGATLNMRVGGKGTDGFRSPNPFTGTLTAAGGFNGGGSNTLTCSGCSFALGGAGGGSSDVRTSADGLVDRVLAAGGGGGAGVGSYPSDPGTGGDSASAAKSVTDGPTTCSGGDAGTLVGPGAAGSGADCSSGSPGAAGGLNGGNGVTWKGAGGGGYFGGGAGAFSGFNFGMSSGGGGGSDYPDPLSPPAGVSNVTVTDGVQSGNGLITVTYATPSAVTLASASAARMGKGVLLRWRTGTEAELLGFQVYRSRGHSWQRLTRSLIVANGSVAGASYRFLDRTARRGVAYRYRIKAVNRDGTTAWFGPVLVT